jgi:hypothetical protein
VRMVYLPQSSHAPPVRERNPWKVGRFTPDGAFSLT